MATTSDSHSAGRGAVLGGQLDGRQLEHQVGDHRAEAAADHLGDDVEAGVAGGRRAEQPVGERHDRVEVGARHRPEHQDQPDQRPAVAAAFSSSWRPTSPVDSCGGHDPRADHGDDQQRRAERLGGEPAGEVEPEVAGAGLDLEASSASVGWSGSSVTTPLVMRVEQHVDPFAQLGDSGVERGLGADGHRVRDRPVQPGRRPGRAPRGPGRTP